MRKCWAVIMFIGILMSAIAAIMGIIVHRSTQNIPIGIGEYLLMFFVILSCSWGAMMTLIDAGN